MSGSNGAASLKVGDRVLLLGSGFTKPGKIVEYRGPLGPKGAHIYRVRLDRKLYGEFREDQLQLVSASDEATAESPKQ